ncbi:hypothetical protein V1478_009079 [Vespula squamosa]|uniref:Uncharacterized protein n=1 Tax=Vespula squamosa TaxID=30214 RepID=A0ABD2ANL7_VESSQ
MAVTTNFNKTNMALFYKGLSERGHRILFSKDPNVDSIIGKIRIDKKNLSEINEDSTEENLLNSVKVIEEEEEVDEEEEEEEEEEENEVKDEGKDYEATLASTS